MKVKKIVLYIGVDEKTAKVADEEDEEDETEDAEPTPKRLGLGFSTTLVVLIVLILAGWLATSLFSTEPRGVGANIEHELPVQVLPTPH